MHIITSFAAAATALLALPTESGNPAGEERVTVTTADLDLRNPRDVRKLDRRLARAAQVVCGQTSEWDLKALNAIRRCQVRSVAAAGKRGLLLTTTARKAADR